MPREIFTELKDRDDPVENVVFPYKPRKRKKLKRVPLKQCIETNICIFYLWKMNNSLLNFFNLKHLNLEMEERAVDFPDDIEVELLRLRRKE